MNRCPKIADSVAPWMTRTSEDTELYLIGRASCKSVISAINQVKNELHGQARGIVFLEKDICHRSRQ